MKKFIFCLLSFCCLVPSSAFAVIEFKNVQEDVKFRQFCHRVGVQSSEAMGTDQIIFKGSIDSTATVSSIEGSDTSPMTFLWPAKLTLDFIDGGSAGTLSCSVVTLSGTDQFGLSVVETTGAVTEAGVTTTTVFSTVASVSAAGCENGDTGDFLLVLPSNEVGLGVKIGAKSDVESVCAFDANTTETECVRYNNGAADDIESNVSVTSHSMNLGAMEIGPAAGGITLAEDDLVCWTVRSSKRSRW